MLAASDYIPTNYPDFSDVVQVNEWTGRERWNAIYTIQLGELIEHDLFSWDLVDWKSAAYNDEQYSRICEYFVERFRFREISIEPLFEWVKMLHRKLVFELMPKYKTMYKLLDDDFDILQKSRTYDKNRKILSEYPETLLSGNSDYASSGTDYESEHVEQGSMLDEYLKYAENYKNIDEQLLDDLECMFIGLYTISINGA